MKTIKKIISLIKLKNTADIATFWSYEPGTDESPARSYFCCRGHLIIKTAGTDADAIKSAFEERATKDQTSKDYWQKEMARGESIFKNAFRDSDPVYFSIVGSTKKSDTLPALTVYESGDTRLYINKKYADIIPADAVIFQDKKTQGSKAPLLFKTEDAAGLICSIHINNTEKEAAIYTEAAANKGGKKAMKKENTTAANTTAENNATAAAKTETAPGVVVVFTDGTEATFPESAADDLRNDPLVASIDGKPTTAENATTENASERSAENESGADSESEKAAEPIELKPENVTEENYRELAFQFFGGLGKKSNSELIMLAGIDAGAITCNMFKSYLFENKTPAFHTFETWKSNGFIVKKGEKAAFSAEIWKYTEKHGKMTAEEAESLNKIMTDADGGQLYHEGDETTKSRFIKKLSYFFGADQVEKIVIKEFSIPEGVTLTKDGKKEILSGDTKPHKDAIKAAGFSWNKKESVWYRFTA